MYRKDFSLARLSASVQTGLSGARRLIADKRCPARHSGFQTREVFLPQRTKRALMFFPCSPWLLMKIKMP